MEAEREKSGQNKARQMVGDKDDNVDEGGTPKNHIKWLLFVIKILNYLSFHSSADSPTILEGLYYEF